MASTVTLICCSIMFVVVGGVLLCLFGGLMLLTMEPPAHKVWLHNLEKNDPLWKQVEKRDREKGYVNVNWRGKRARTIGEYGGYVL